MTDALRLVVAITGASGAIYAQRCLTLLARIADGVRADLIARSCGALDRAGQPPALLPRWGSESAHV